MTSPPASIRTLLERLEPEELDVARGRARVRLHVAGGGGSYDVEASPERVRLRAARPEVAPDAELTAEQGTWADIADDPQGGMAAFRGGRLAIRRNLHVGVNFLAAASGSTDPGRLRFSTLRTRCGRVSTLQAGEGEPLVLLHGLGATKAEFLPTVAALAPAGRRLIAIDLPGFGDSDKPLPASYDAAFFARWVEATLDALEIDRADVLGHSMGGRVALETGMRNPDRVRHLVLMTPSLAWRAGRRWAPYLRLVRPELGLIQPTPRPVIEGIVRRLIPGARDSWTGAAVDEFLRAYLNPRGRVAFYAAARQIYLERGEGRGGFWTRLEALAPRSLFIWGRRDQLVPIGFARHVRAALPAAEHVEIDCGHVPQLERPAHTRDAIARFLRQGFGSIAG